MNRKRKRNQNPDLLVKKRIKVENENLLLITDEFLNSLKYNLPFRVKTFNDHVYYVLENPTFCQVFWLKFLHDRVAPAFKRQKVITSGEGDDMDLTMQVWINKDTLELFKPPVFFRNVAYFNSMIDSKESVSFLKIKSSTVRNVGVFSLAVVGLLGMFLPNLI